MTGFDTAGYGSFPTAIETKDKQIPSEQVVFYKTMCAAGTRDEILGIMERDGYSEIGSGVYQEGVVDIIRKSLKGKKFQRFVANGKEDLHVVYNPFDNNSSDFVVLEDRTLDNKNSLAVGYGELRKTPKYKMTVFRILETGRLQGFVKRLEADEYMFKGEGVFHGEYFLDDGTRVDLNPHGRFIKEGKTPKYTIQFENDEWKIGYVLAEKIGEAVFVDEDLDDDTNPENIDVVS
jgi:hypothetical protein